MCTYKDVYVDVCPTAVQLEWDYNVSTCCYGDGDLVKTSYSVLQRRHFLSFGDVISFRSEVSKVFFPFYCSFPCLHLAPTLEAGLAITVKAGDDEKDEEV